MVRFQIQKMISGTAQKMRIKRKKKESLTRNLMRILLLLRILVRSLVLLRILVRSLVLLRILLLRKTT